MSSVMSFREETSRHEVRDYLATIAWQHVRFTRVYPDLSYRPTICGDLLPDDAGGYFIRVTQGEQVTDYHMIDEIISQMRDRDHNGVLGQTEDDRLLMAEICPIRNGKYQLELFSTLMPKKNKRNSSLTPA